MTGLMQIDYGKLSEQYASFLSALASVSITVLAIVLSLPSLQPKRRAPGEVNYRSHLIVALIVATVTSFVGAQLMAETASYVSSFLTQQAVAGEVGPAKPLGQRLFLLASINIYVAVMVVIFALMLLTAEYRRVNEDAHGVRRISICIFGAVAVCILCWMFFSVVLRMPSRNVALAVAVPVGIVVGVGLGFWLVRKTYLWELLVPATFISIISLTVITLGWFVISLHCGFNGETTDFDIGLFVLAVVSTCTFLGFVGKRLILDGGDASLWPVGRQGQVSLGSAGEGVASPPVTV